MAGVPIVRMLEEPMQWVIVVNVFDFFVRPHRVQRLAIANVASEIVPMPVRVLAAMNVTELKRQRAHIVAARLAGLPKPVAVMENLLDAVLAPATGPAERRPAGER